MSQPETRRELRMRRSRQKTNQRPVTSFLTMMAATGLLATTALPSYGYNPSVTAMAGLGSPSQQAVIDSPAQTISLASLKAVEFSRGDYSTTSESSFALQASRIIRYTGPRAEDYVANPRFSSLTSSNVMRAASEQVGVPYVFGGSTPAGMDCSGYVKFVYSQFGIAMPHSVYQQSRLPFAKKISREEAVPGDIVVFNDYSHNGIYAGNGNFYHAPQPGDKVKLAPIFTDSYHIIRFGEIVNE